ncbi:MAG: OB-fold domain-containing protein [Thermoflexaceae bacterium]|nr:OB-fold domain-containing protein [Thermoflexaceae bacterium]
MTQETIVPKPLPEPDEASRPFFDGARQGRLMLMKCLTCGTVRLPSRRHCDRCLSQESEWVAASGRGTVRTFGIMHQRYHAAFANDIPYNVTVVELEEGPRLPTNLIGIANGEIRVGMEVVVDWEHHDDVTIPRFRPA